VALGAILAAPLTAEDGHAHHAHETSARYTRAQAAYVLPQVELVDRHGERVELAEVLSSEDGPVVLQFIFTTCPAVCPMLSRLLASAGEELGPELEGVRRVSITIDPEHDTPERLRRYAELLEADPDWTFLTGDLDDVIAAQKAFGAYSGNKMRHPPLTFLRAPGAKRWLRFEGFPSGAELAAEIRGLRSR